MNNMEVKALLFDTRSIQKYIFSGNKLRTHIGASYIVENVFATEMVPLLEGLFPQHSDLKSWDSKISDKPADFSNMTEDCKIAYIGGGNALVLFRADIDDTVLKGIVTDFTRNILVKYPGLKTGAAIGRLDFSSAEAYRNSDRVLHMLLKHNQNTVFPQVSIPYTGLTQACSVNGEAANYWDIHHKIRPDIKEKPRFFSQEVAAKALAVKATNDALMDTFADSIQGYAFPMEINELGQADKESYIAVVHIDGNNMGQRFMKCENLESRVDLSKNVKKKTENAFSKLLQSIVDEYSTYEKPDFDLKNNNLPIRPLILGGDDVTFVCVGRMALTYAKRFIEYMRAPDGKMGGIECCGGVAILPESYPFFRGYELAEQLCAEAKKRSRKNNDSWLDFARLHGEQAPTLEQIRVQEYTGVQGPLHFGPYKVGDAGYHYSIDNLFDCIAQLNRGITSKNGTPSGMAKNKIKELRDVLQHGHGMHDCQRFMEQLAHVGQTLPSIAEWNVYETKLWHEGKTPYVDAIEMMDYMPKGGSKWIRSFMYK